ncbi:hypothetical protein BJF89_01000 [Corynebacterium sp. CNJ-954]|uniref:phage major capsid protein n=1 Tax=Corynebacterium sp. CNJ-954 TaxID=1904962 RepID=UPI000963081C|nr:hypothetical protein [Corynebacterium sp. CNJ-954]OLT54841.1 hypothetical protein BJF89_01000 [Corynebacterium sp. CNJ-954]
MTTPITVGGFSDNPTATVEEILGAPKVLNQDIYDYIKEYDVVADLFTDAGPNSGSIAFTENVAQFSEDGLADVAEFAEIPTTRVQTGEKKVIFAQKTGRALEISYEQRDDNKLYDVQNAISQLKNRVVRQNSRSLLRSVQESDIPDMAAAAAWGATGGDPVSETAAAIDSFAEQLDIDGNEAALIFEPDTLVLPSGMLGAFSSSDSVWKHYAAGTLAPDNAAVTGKVYDKFMGLNVVIPKWWPVKDALVCQAKDLAFYSDSRPLTVSGPIDVPTNEYFRTQVTQRRIVGVHNPTAGIWIKGVKA